MALPPVFRIVESDPFERGKKLGQAARSYISGSIDLYKEIFQHYANMEWDAVVDFAGRYRKSVEAYAPAVAKEIDGMAEGAGFRRDELLALNVRSEVMFGLRSQGSAECTSFFAGALANKDGHVRIGQNWDWKPACRETAILVELDQGDYLPSIVTIVEAGLVAKTGFNSAGIGLATNTLITPMDRGEPVVPYHLMLRHVLNSHTLEQAVAGITGVRRAASANYLIANKDGEAISVEGGAGGVGNFRVVHPTNDTIGHSNSFVCDVTFDDLGVKEFPDTTGRVASLTRELQKASGNIDTEEIHRMLSLHEPGFPDAICRHPNEDQMPIDQLSTNTSSIYDLTTLTARVTLGTPCENDYEEYIPAFASHA